MIYDQASTNSVLSEKHLFYPYIGVLDVIMPTFSGRMRAGQETRV